MRALCLGVRYGDVDEAVDVKLREEAKGCLSLRRGLLEGTVCVYDFQLIWISIIPPSAPVTNAEKRAASLAFTFPLLNSRPRLYIRADSS